MHVLARAIRRTSPETRGTRGIRATGFDSATGAVIHYYTTRRLVRHTLRDDDDDEARDLQIRQMHNAFS